MRSYNCERLIELGYLNEDDVKILKHLQAIDNIYKKKNPNISHLFAFAGTLETCIELNGEEWCFDSFIHIPCDGGDDPIGVMNIIPIICYLKSKDIID